MLTELWIKIFEQLDCTTILNIKLTCQYFNKICVDYDIYMKRKFRGFPRLKGKCCIHHSIISDEIVRGDIICIDDNVHIFDGHQLIKFDKIFPKKFKILDDNVPINYWANNKTKYNLRYCINLVNIRQQCIDNIYISNILGDLHTSFIFDNQEVRILYSNVHIGDGGKMKTLKNIFETNEMLPISFAGKGIYGEIYLKI